MTTLLPGATGSSRCLSNQISSFLLSESDIVISQLAADEQLQTLSGRDANGT